MSTLDDLRPKQDCPKCGTVAAFGVLNPVWHDAEAEYSDGTPGTHDWHRPERLEWFCQTCGFVIETKTLDAR